MNKFDLFIILFVSFNANALDQFDRGAVIFDEAQSYLVGISPNFDKPVYGETDRGACTGVAISKRFVLTHKNCLLDSTMKKPLTTLTVQPYPFDGRRLPAKALYFDFASTEFGLRSGLKVSPKMGLIDLGEDVLPAFAPFRTKSDPSLYEIMRTSAACGIAYSAHVKKGEQATRWGAGLRPLRIQLKDPKSTVSAIDQDELLVGQMSGYTTGDDRGAPVLCQAKLGEPYRVVGLYTTYFQHQGLLPQPLIQLQNLSAEDEWLRSLVPGL